MNFLISLISSSSSVNRENEITEDNIKEGVANILCVALPIFVSLGVVFYMLCNCDKINAQMITNKTCGNEFFVKLVQESRQKFDDQSSDTCCFAVLNTLCRTKNNYQLSNIFPKRTLSTQDIKDLGIYSLLG